MNAQIEQFRPNAGAEDFEQRVEEFSAKLVELLNYYDLTLHGQSTRTSFVAYDGDPTGREVTARNQEGKYLIISLEKSEFTLRKPV